MDTKPKGSQPTPVLEMPESAVRRDFTLDGRGAVVALVRCWLRGVLPAGCGARDDMGLVVGEVVANASVHGGGGEVTLSVGHAGSRLLGRLVHHRPPVGDLLPKWEATAQTSRLLLGESVEPEELVESSRGLLVVWHLSEGFTYRPEEERSVMAWAVPGCSCRGAR